MSRILYIILSDILPGSSNDGPSVRSNAILKEFELMDTDVDFIVGENAKERYEKFRKINSDKQYDYCYIESKVGVTRFYDTLIINSVKKKFQNIAVGLYYRDMYWAYNIQISKGKIKNLFVPLVNKWFLRFISKRVDVIFGQSKSFCKKLRTYVGNKCKIEVLPPGCENISIKQNAKTGVIYVGEIDPVFSGIELLIEAMKLVNLKQKVPLNLVCRKHEFEKNEYIQRIAKEYDWLNVYHETKETIHKIYNQSNLAVIPRYKDEYTKLCLPIKLFEYISYELPIVAVDHGEVSNFIKKYQIGSISNGNPEDFANKILEILNMSEEEIKLIKNNLKLCKEANTWKTRVEKIDKVLRTLH